MVRKDREPAPCSCGRMIPRWTVSEPVGAGWRSCPTDVSMRRSPRRHRADSPVIKIERMRMSLKVALPAVLLAATLFACHQGGQAAAPVLPALAGENHF